MIFDIYRKHFQHKMIAKHLLFHGNIKYLSTSMNVFRRSHKLNRQLPFKNAFSQSLKPIFYNSARRVNTTSASNKTLPIILGLGAVGGAIAAYNILKKEPSVSDDVDEFEDAPFVHEHLQEDLALLSEFGSVPYLLIGGGCASFTAYRAIRTKDPRAKVLVIGEEPFLPYMRPPLSKEVWFDSKSDVAETLSFSQWDGRSRSVFFEPPEFYFSVKELLENKNGGISIIRGKKVVKVDPEAQVVYLDKGEKISYEKCLLATGSKPKNLPVFENADKSVKKHITMFRNIQDYRKLDKIHKKVKSIVIVGGGFLGSELACGLLKKGGPSDLEVLQIFPETGNMGKVLPEYLGKWTSKKLEGEGVKIIPEVSIQSISKEGNKIHLVLSNGEVIKTDHVIVAVGAEPNTDFAKVSGLEVNETHGGFLVNSEMEARKNLWIAGDVSCFYDIKLGRRRVEHHDHAMVSGRLAGENMAGDHKPYRHQSMFWSDLGPEVGFEAIGLIDSSLPTIGVFAKDEVHPPKPVADNTAENDTESIPQTVGKTKTNPVPRAPENGDNYGRGVIFYLRDDIIVGILLWNVFSKVSVARQIINESKSSDDVTEIAKLFEIYDTE